MMGWTRVDRRLGAWYVRQQRYLYLLCGRRKCNTYHSLVFWKCKPFSCFRGDGGCHFVVFVVGLKDGGDVVRCLDIKRRV